MMARPRNLPASAPGAADPGAAVEPILRRWLGLDAQAIGLPALRRAAESRMAAVGQADAAAYADLVARSPAERDLLVEEVVVGESWFFRDPQVFEYVAGSATARAAVPGRGPVRILCIPCAGGEEPYSVAMALLDAGLEPGQFVIDAVDVSHAALIRAARGSYSLNAFRNADLSCRDRWFTVGATRSVVADRIRGCVALSWGNVLEPDFCAGRPAYDIIFCRNLLIYLTAEARRRVEETVDRLLVADGILVLGAAEPPILRGAWLPAGAASVFALRRGPRPAAAPAPAPAAAPPAAGSSRVAGQRPPAAAIRPGGPPPGAPAGVTAADAQPDDLPTVLRRAGEIANAGRHAEAIAYCEQARTRLPPSADLFFLLGMLHQAVGALDSAESCLHKTLYLDANHEEAFLALALLAAQRGDPRMAETYRQSAGRVLARKAGP
jgi:chemotaxis protein methyltransferase WspC